jgi:hypothetical protein
MKLNKMMQNKLFKTKQLAIGLALLTYGITTAHAQDSDNDSRRKFMFGVKAGINNSNVWDEQGQDFRADSKFGFVGGLFLGIPISSVIGLQPEILLSQKGFKGAGTILGNPYSFSRTTTFVDIPLLLQIKPIEFLSIVLGPQFSYLMHQKDVYTFGTNSVEQEQEFKRDNIRKNILGFTAGADIHISHLVVSGRVGFDFQANNGDGTSSTPRYKNQWIQLTLGYKI